MTDAALFSQLVLRIVGGLLHFVWQGAALAFLAALCLAFLERRPARTRYTVAAGFLSAMLAAPLLTVFFFDSADAILSRTLLLLGQSSVVRLKTEPWAFWIAAMWLAGVATGWIRLAVGWRLSLRMIREASIPDAKIAALFERVVQQTKSVAVRLLVSTRAVSPVVIGWLRPVVLLPLSVLTGLSVEELRAVVAHELAHVRRQDYLVNMLQRVVESLLFYHPAVWWLSARVRAERELAADEAAIEICDDPAVLARALVRLEETRTDRIAAIAATGGNVANRVARLLNREPDRPGWQPIRATVTFMGLWVTAGLWPFAAVPSERSRPVGSPLQASSMATLAPVESALTTGLGALAALAPAAPEKAPPSEAPQDVPSGQIVVKGQVDVRRVSGQLRDSNGQAGAVAKLWIIAKPEVLTIPNVKSYIAETDQQGRYQLNIPPGRYTIAIEDRDRGNRGTRTWRVEAPQRRVTVPAEPGSVDLDLEFTALALNQPFGTFGLRPDEVRGRIEFDDGSPLPVGTLSYFQVILSSSGGYFTTQPFTNTQGLFTLPAAPGEYTVRLAPLWLGNYLKSMTYGNIDLTRNLLPVKTGGGDTEIRIVLTKARPADIPPGVKVSGRITDWTPGRPGLALIAVVAPAEGFQVGNVIPKRDGSFEISGVPPGQYAIGAGVSRSIVFVGQTDLTNLALTTDNPEFRASLASPYTGSGSYIRGVVDAGNAVIPQFEVRFAAAHPGAASVPPHIVTVLGPEFSIILPEGAYRISTSGLPQGYAVKSVIAGPMDLTEPFLVTYKGVADRFTGAPITSAKGITISLTAPSQ